MFACRWVLCYVEFMCKRTTPATNLPAKHCLPVKAAVVILELGLWCAVNNSASPDCVVDLECRTGRAHSELQEDCELFFSVIPVLHSYTYTVYLFQPTWQVCVCSPESPSRLLGHPDPPLDQLAAAPDPHCPVLHPSGLNSLQLCFLKKPF